MGVNLRGFFGKDPERTRIMHMWKNGNTIPQIVNSTGIPWELVYLTVESPE